MAQAIIGSTRRHSVRGPWARLAARVFNVGWLWHFRATSRRHLSRLDDHLLRDIGLDRAAVEREILKPFWKG